MGQINIEIPGAFLVVALIFLLIGYFMGRGVKKVPVPFKDKKAYNMELFDPGDYEEEIDPFQEAMTEPEEEDEKPKSKGTVE